MRLRPGSSGCSKALPQLGQVRQGMTAEQAKQVPQAGDLGVWVGLAGLEPATERL
jgi:hypothetical protein